MTTDKLERDLRSLAETPDVVAGELLAAAAKMLHSKQQEVWELQAYINPERPSSPVVEGFVEELNDYAAAHPDAENLINRCVNVIVSVESMARFDRLFPGRRPRPTTEQVNPVSAALRATLVASPQLSGLIMNAASLLDEQQRELERNRVRDDAEHAAHLERVRADSEARKTWLAEHDDRPDTYLGYLQPGASPTFYGPDDVVVDGDWLEAFEAKTKRDRKVLKEIRRALADRGRTPEQVLAAVRKAAGV